LQDWQNEANDSQEDKSPAGQQYQLPLALLIQLALSEAWRQVSGGSGNGT
jgi:hypothetical protein